MISKALLYYVGLQKRRADRWFLEIGINPLIGYVISMICFGILLKSLYSRALDSEIIFGVLTFILISAAGIEDRIVQLKHVFSNKEFYTIRIWENLLIVLPMTIYLVINLMFLYAVGLVLLAVVMTMFNWGINLPVVIPSPFSKNPFEFTVGFRRSLWLISVGYIILYKAIEVDNFNLGLFVLGLMFFMSMTFYTKPEHPFFVWIYKDHPVDFLKRKVKDALVHVTLITVPVVIILGISFPDKLVIILIIQFIGYFFMVSVVMAKYASFPAEMNLPQGILYALCLWFPPLLLIVIPMFYKKAILKLKIYLQ